MGINLTFPDGLVVHVHQHNQLPHEVVEALRQLHLLPMMAAAIRNLTEKVDDMNQALQDLQDAVTQEDTVIGSAITLIQGIPALIAAAGTDAVALRALTQDIQAKGQALAAAVVANTPAADGTGGSGTGASTGDTGATGGTDTGSGAGAASGPGTSTPDETGSFGAASTDRMGIQPVKPGDPGTA